MISYNKAYNLTLENIHELPLEEVDLLSAVDRIIACDLSGLVNSPSIDASLKDGYAIHSEDVASATIDNPAYLQVVGDVTAGGHWDGNVLPGQAVRILSGAPIPQGADAVIAEEFTHLNQDALNVVNDAHRGRNIMSKGSDVHEGQLMERKGTKLTPPKLGSLAAAGYSKIPVVKAPKAAILATGDEVIAPGEPLIPGKLYASNLVNLAAWCIHYGFSVKTFISMDVEGLIRENLENCMEGFDVVLTSGGAWSGERDLTVKILSELGWKEIYHRVKIGPGKAVAFGYCSGTPVFCLPGGPPSNAMAFMQLALPGMHKMSGRKEVGLPAQPMLLAESISGQSDWTQFIHGHLEETNGLSLFHPITFGSRLQMMSTADAIVKIPEGVSRIEKSEIIEGQLLV